MDRNLIAEGEMLDDKIINAAQKLIKQKTGCAGLQDPVFGQKSFNRNPMNVDSVQVVHTGALHWVTVARVGNDVFIYDSLNSRKPAARTLEAINQLFGQISYTLSRVQQQEGGVDCGLFALAFCDYVAQGKADNLPDAAFDQDLMRLHLVTCFESGIWESFPLVGDV